MKSKWSKGFVSILIAIVFMAGSLDLAVAKSSSFGGGSKSSSSSSFSRGSGSSSSFGKSSSGSGSSSGSSGGFSFFGGGSKSSTNTGFKTSAPGSSSAPSSTNTSKNSFTNSSGSTASDSSKSGSAFSSRVNAGIDKNSNTNVSSNRSSSTGWFGNWGSSSKQNAPNTRVTIIYKNRPSGWTPHYYGNGYSGSSTNDFIDLWWKMEMLKAVTDRHERDQISRDIKSDPNYEKWRNSEADKLSKENADLKAELAMVDSSNSDNSDDQSHTNWFFILWILGFGLLGVIFWLFIRR